VLVSQSTIELVDQLGSEHNKSVSDWKNEIFEGLLKVKVSIMIYTQVYMHHTCGGNYYCHGTVKYIVHLQY